MRTVVIGVHHHNAHVIGFTLAIEDFHIVAEAHIDPGDQRILHVQLLKLRAGDSGALYAVIRGAIPADCHLSKVLVGRRGSHVAAARRVGDHSEHFSRGDDRRHRHTIALHVQRGDVLHDAGRCIGSVGACNAQWLADQVPAGRHSQRPALVDRSVDARL